MARRPTLLIVSLLANLALGTALLWLHRPHSPSEGASLQTGATAFAAAAEVVPANAVWTRTSARPNDPGYAESLRGFGFPERVVRSLVRYRLEQEYLPEVQRLRSGSERLPYWQRGRYTAGMVKAGRGRMREILYEIDNRARTVLGPSADTALQGDYSEGDLRRYGNLPAQKISAIKAIRRDYSQLSNEVQEASQGILFPEDREKLEYLKREEQADLGRLLTPEELQQYQRCSSMAAHFARNEIQYLEDATETEFLKIYSVRRDFDERYGIGNLTPAQEKAREAAQSELQAAIQAALGSERYTEYQIVNDQNYEATRDFVTRSGLSADLAKPLVAVQRDYLQKSRATRSNASPSAEQQATQLHTLAQEASEAVRAKIGDEKFAAYQNSAAGRWLAQLASSAESAAQ